MNWFSRFIRSPESACTPVPDQVRECLPVRRRPAEARPRYLFTDPSIRIAAVGDIHGRLDLLRGLAGRLDELAADASKRLVEVYVGDYVDRAGDAKGVIDFLLRRSALPDRDLVFLMGNHEQMLLSALENDRDFLFWLESGGNMTLLSYGVSPADAGRNPQAKRMAFREALPASHLEFLNRLAPSYARGGFYFSHAGVRPGTPLEEQKTKDLLWIRNRFLSSNAYFGAIVVHGHTPVRTVQFKMNRIAIDTGAYFSGNLTCVLITDGSVGLLDGSMSPT